jgi:hypothetical protein
VGGSALACLIFMGGELGTLYGVRISGPGGLVGVAAAAGAVFLVGPTMIIPAFIGGLLLGDLLVKHRPLSDSETRLARQVFGDTLPLDRIIVTNLSGDSDRPFTVPNIDGDILMNMGPGHDTALDQYTYKSYTQKGEVFIHELTHAWQMAHAPFAHDVFWGAAQAKLAGSSAYDYGLPGPDWHRLGLEQQASIVNEWFAGTTTHMNPKIARTIASDQNDPYYGYISNNILLGQW